MFVLVLGGCVAWVVLFALARMVCDRGREAVGGESEAVF